MVVDEWHGNIDGKHFEREGDISNEVDNDIEVRIQFTNQGWKTKTLWYFDRSEYLINIKLLLYVYNIAGAIQRRYNFLKQHYSGKNKASTRDHNEL